MKRKISTVILSCLTCIGILAYSALPVRAFSPDTCSHPNFALGTDGPTGEYEYLESGHYEVWGTGHVCLRCGYEYYTDTHLVKESDHEYSAFFECDGVVHIHSCVDNDCPYSDYRPCTCGHIYNF